jgi:hypothetical protein
MTIGKAIGIASSGCRSRRPASISVTVTSGPRDRRAATTAPAEPAPTTM